MSKPAAGTYVIYNRILSPTGDKLAITFNGQGNAATVTPLTNADTQKWNIVDFDTKTQSVKPLSAPNLEAAWGSGFVTVIPSGAYVWAITSSDTGYTIQDGGLTAFWGVNQAVGSAQVSIGAGTGNEKQRWILARV